MNWRRRFSEWLAALRLAQKSAGRIPVWTLIRALLSGVVPARVWRQRIRTCYSCPAFNRDGWRCRGAVPQVAHLGCDCYIPLSALSAKPYSGGCWGRTYMRATVPAGFGIGLIETSFGWPAYTFRSRWERLWSPVRFLFRK